jgi:hypothetical protein
MIDDAFFLSVARTLTDKLMPAFAANSELRRVLVDFKTEDLEDQGWADRSTLLADAGSFSLDFFALTHHTGDPKYARMALNARAFGPIPATHINYDTLFPTVLRYSFDAFADSYFEDLFKFQLYSPQSDATGNAQSRKDFVDIWPECLCDVDKWVMDY